MQGAIRKSDILAHPLTTIRCFGWVVLMRALFADRGQTFLDIVGRTLWAPGVPSELPEFLARGIGLERRAADIYRSLASRVADDEPLLKLLAELARQEEDHAELLELCHASSRRRDWSEGRIDPWRDVVAGLEVRMAALRRNVELVASRTEALRLVLDIESSEINDVFAAIVEASQSGFVLAARAFRWAEEEHVDLICTKIPALAPELAEACRALRR